MRHSKILIARSTIQPKLSKIKNHLPVFDEFWCISWCFFDFTQFWLDGWPGNEYFWIYHKISNLLTPLTSLGVHPQWFETTVWNRYERFLLQCRNASAFLPLNISALGSVVGGLAKIKKIIFFASPVCFLLRVLMWQQAYLFWKKNTLDLNSLESFRTKWTFQVYNIRLFCTLEYASNDKILIFKTFSFIN